MAAYYPVPQQGLCSTCQHNRECIQVQRAAGPIWHCEEFAAHPYRGEGGHLTAWHGSELGHAAVRGLCGDCAHRNLCDLAAPGCEVWNCEEYA